MKYKLHRKDVVIRKHDIYILPTFRLFLDDIMYAGKNVSIEFHFLTFHSRLLFLKEVRYE